MVMEWFRDVNFRRDSLARIDLCNQIIDDYLGQGLRLTLRQLYYQLVTRNEITNEEKSYKNLGKLVSDGRLAGLIDWDAIEDRVRRPITQPQFDNLQDLVNTALDSYRLDRWEGQECYVELWVEKDALAGVLLPLARQHHVTMMVNRGYSSQSAMYEASGRFCHPDQNVILYLGDHDPSGEDMVRDIDDRLNMFGVQNLEVVKVALTTAQVHEHNPPPNPAKVSDPRAANYIAIHGPTSWEVDALRPEVLQQIIRRSFANYVDLETMDDIIEREEQDKERLRTMVDEDAMRRGTPVTPTDPWEDE